MEKEEGDPTTETGNLFWWVTFLAEPIFFFLMSTARQVLKGNAGEVVAIEFFQSSASGYLGLVQRDCLRGR